MQLKELLTDEDAVSPVIGVILMVAITVILAAVIGTFVLGLGDQVSNASPQASFTFDFTDNSGSDDQLDITHDGGDSIEAGNLVFVGDDNIRIDSNGDGTFGGDDTRVVATADSLTATDDVNAASTFEIRPTSNSGDDDLADESVRVVWESSGGDSTATLAQFDGPNA